MSCAEFFLLYETSNIYNRKPPQYTLCTQTTFETWKTNQRDEEIVMYKKKYVTHTLQVIKFPDS